MLTESEKLTYSWQLEVPGFGESKQLTLKNSTALVTRVGGLGGPVALSLAAAGIGKLILAHAGNLREDDLNRQILMSRDHVGKSRVQCAAQTLNRFNSSIDVEIFDENVTEENIDKITGNADIIFSCAPLFEERFLLNEAAIKGGKKLVDCAMYSMEGQVMTMLPGITPCLKCIYPDKPTQWERKFPVIGAVSSLVAQIGVIEGIKLLCNFQKPSLGKLIRIDASSMDVKKIELLPKRVDCLACN
jgi:molybdopterin/thiamine biosynthesis adenylyltransferase